MNLKMEQYKQPTLNNREEKQNRMSRALETSGLYRHPLKTNRASGTKRNSNRRSSICVVRIIQDRKKRRDEKSTQSNNG